MILGIIGSVLAIIVLLLKYWPTWRQEHDLSDKSKATERAGEQIAMGDDIGLSNNLSDLVDRVRAKQDGDSPK